MKKITEINVGTSGYSITIFHIFKKLEEIMNTQSRERYKETQTEPLA
jgi:hypothetical protein